MDLPELRMLFNVFTSTSNLPQEIICSTAETLWAQHVMHMEPGLETGFFSCCYFPAWWKTPPEVVLMAVRRRDTNLCCNFLKPEFAGARHWKILSLWSQVGLLNSTTHCLPHSAQFLTDKTVLSSSVRRSSLWLHSWIIPSQLCHCSYIYSSQGFETFYAKSCTPNKILLQIWDQLVWGEEQKASLHEFWG